jgi:putative cardiolipin synthase
VQHRTHRKILLADNSIAVIGGRNIADDYFDLSTHYNFLDSDLMIHGSAVSAMQASFDLYWNSPWALNPEDSGWEKNQPVITDFLTPNAQDQRLVALIADLSYQPQFTTCNDIQFVTDYPGSGVNYRKVFPAIAAELESAKSEVIAESPYFVLRSDGAEMINKLTGRGVQLSILTNSLKSTDAYYTVAPLFPSLSALAQPNFKLFAYNGAPPTAYDSIPNRSDRWGVHAKRGVIDESTVLIGTYNIDPRSANLNSELMVICRGNRDLAMQTKNSILARIEQSKLVLDNTKEPDADALIGDAPWKSIAMMFVAMPVSKVFDFLL